MSLLYLIFSMAISIAFALSIAFAVAAFCKNILFSKAVMMPSLQDTKSDIIQYFSSALKFNALCLMAAIIVSMYLQRNTEVGILTILMMMVSFVTACNWLIEPASQLAPITINLVIIPLMVVATSTGMCLALGIIRTIANSDHMNFYRDFYQITAFIIIPGAFLMAIILWALGVNWLYFLEEYNGNALLSLYQAIKILGVNGGGFFVENSGNIAASPSDLVIFVHFTAMLVLPFVLTFLLFWIGYRKLSLTICITNFTFLLVTSFIILHFNDHPSMYTDQTHVIYELRVIYNVFASAINGAAIMAYDNFNGIAESAIIFNMIASGAIVGGLGSGFFSMLTYLIIALVIWGFISGQSQTMFGREINNNDVIIAVGYNVVSMILITLGSVIYQYYTLIDLVTDENSRRNFAAILFMFASTVMNNGAGYDEYLFDNTLGRVVAIFNMLSGRLLFGFGSFLLAYNIAGKKLAHGNFKRMENRYSVYYMLIVAIISIQLIYLPLLVLGPYVR